jgi:ACS family sodium-dependent inorganic phosphate cotransporter
MVWCCRAKRHGLGAPVPALFVLSVLLYVERATFPRVISSMDDLSKVQAGEIMSAFYVGYATTQLPGGWLAVRYGGDFVLRCCTLAWGLLTCLQWQLAPTSPLLLGLLRVGVGCLQGLSFPAIHSVLGASVGAGARPTAVTVVTSGMYFGTAIGTVLPFATPHTLTCAGLVAMLWSVCCGSAVALQPDASVSPTPRPTAFSGDGTVSFVRILRSRPVWGVLLSSFAFHWLFYALLSWLPFIYASHGVESPALRAAPFLAMFFATAASGILGNALARVTGKLASRKIMNSGGLMLSTVPAQYIAFARAPAASVALIALTLGCSCLARGGFGVNHMDLGPGHAGMIMSLVNTAGTVAGVVGVAVTGRIFDHYLDGAPTGGGRAEAFSEGLSAVFALSAVVAFGGSLAFMLLASVENQFAQRELKKLRRPADVAGGYAILRLPQHPEVVQWASPQGDVP